jgi:hypothetical protein
MAGIALIGEKDLIWRLHPPILLSTERTHSYKVQPMTGALIEILYRHLEQLQTEKIEVRHVDRVRITKVYAC